MGIISSHLYLTLIYWIIY